MPLFWLGKQCSWFAQAFSSLLLPFTSQNFTNINTRSSSHCVQAVKLSRCFGSFSGCVFNDWLNHVDNIVKPCLFLLLLLLLCVILGLCRFVGLSFAELELELADLHNDRHSEASFQLEVLVLGLTGVLKLHGEGGADTKESCCGKFVHDFTLLQ